DSGVASNNLVALKLHAPETTITGVRFVVDAHQSDVNLTALRLVGGKHHVERCEFVQVQPSSRLDPQFASIHAAASSDPDVRHSVVTINDCAFLGFGFAKRTGGGEGEMATDVFEGADSGGKVAILRTGSARVTAENCVFGPHAAMARLDGGVAGDA